MKSIISALFFLGYPIISIALPCANEIEVANQANTEIKSYPRTFQNKSFDWMNLTWLDQKLGVPEKEFLDNTQIRYSWKCSTYTTPVFSVIVDGRGKIMNVSGIYSSMQGSGLFSADVQQSVATPVTNRATAMQAPTSATVKPATLPVCNKIINQIDADTKKYALTLSKQHLPWMSLSWLKKKLGKADTSKVSESYYGWDKFTYHVYPNGASQTTGNAPGNASSVGEYIAILGQPKTTLSDSFTKYNWKCPDKLSNLTVIADKNKKIIGFVTSANDSQGTHSSTAQLAKTSIDEKLAKTPSNPPKARVTQ